MTSKHGAGLLYKHKRRHVSSRFGPQALRTVAKYGGAEVELLDYSKGRRRLLFVMTELHDKPQH
jgi:hypothetical protein